MTEIEVVFGTTADEGLLYLLTALNNPTELDLWRWKNCQKYWFHPSVCPLECIYPLRENWDTFGPGFLFNRATKEEITEEDVAKVKRGNDFDLCRLWRPMLWWISTLVGLKTWMRNIWTASLTCSLMLASYMVYTGENKLKVNHAKQWPWQIVSGGLV